MHFAVRVITSLYTLPLCLSLFTMSRTTKPKKLKFQEVPLSSTTDISFPVETPAEKKHFAAAILGEDKAPPQHNFPSPDNSSNTFAQNEPPPQKHENVLPKPSTSPQSPNKRPASPLIAYIESVSPLKRSKTGSVEYFNLKLQSASGTQQAVCFSRSKRSFFDDKARTKTALKIERYNTAKDGQTIFINDMTKLSSPPTSEYNFQFTESHNTNYLTLQSMLDNALDMDMVDVTAKLLHKDNETQTVGASKLKKANCHIADQTASIKLILWENNIEEVDAGQV